MGTQYSQQSASGYNSSPPADDGSQVDSNKTKWSHVIDKVGDPIKALADAIDSALREHFDEGPITTSVNYSTLASDFNKTIEASSGATITLLAAGTAGAGYRVTIKNTDTSDVTVEVDSSGTIDGDSSLTLAEGQSETFMVNSAAGEYMRISGLDSHQSETVTLGGDFDADQEVVCYRIGDQVTVTAKSVLSHTTDTGAQAGGGTIPTQFRPSISLTTLYWASGTQIAQLVMTADGDFQLSYRDYTGSNTNASSSLAAPTISYVIT